VEFLNNFLGWNTDRTNEQLGLLLNDHIDQFIEFTLCIVVIGLSSVTSKSRDEEINSKCYFSASYLHQKESLTHEDQVT